jgi:hypothetical protein
MSGDDYDSRDRLDRVGPRGTVGARITDGNERRDLELFG